MTWPTPQDYNEAIQNPASCFTDPVLKAGHPQLTPLGLPRPITGNFASVYRMHCAGTDWAVRCFWREFADLQARYAAISAHLSAARLPYTVGFEYLPRGIAVRGIWYPVLKMEWVDGELLNTYIERHLGDRAALSALAARWLDMVKALEGAGIAHGDLQHGNVLVQGGALKLVDYDGMFVPALAGRGSHEIGHQNYQHPQRSGADFDRTTDRFSAWVIYLSLRALAVEPALWSRLGAGDEALLLRRDDLVHPAHSPVFVALDALPDADMRNLVQAFRGALDVDPGAVPELGVPVAAALQSSRLELPSRLRLLRDRVIPSAPEVAPLVPSHPSHTVPAWLVDHLEPETDTPAEFEPIPPVVRGALVAPVLLVGFMFVWVSLALVDVLPAAGLSLVGILLAACTILVSYRRDRAVCDLNAVLCEERELTRLIRAAHRAAAGYRRESARVTVREEREVARVTGRRDALVRREREERTAVEAECTAQLAEIDRRREQIAASEREELARALEAIQGAFRRDFLRRQSIRGAEIPGLNWAVKGRLMAAGIWSASDVTAGRLPDLPLKPEQRQELAEWRVEVELDARRAMPAALPQATEEPVRARYARQLERVERGRAAIERDAEARLAAVDSRYLWKIEELQRQVDAMGAEAEATRRELEESIAAAEETLPDLERCLAECAAELQFYSGVTFLRYLSIAVGRTDEVHPD